MALAKAASVAAADVRKALNSRVVGMYRQLSRDAPRIIVMYNLEFSSAEVRHMLLLHFRKNAHVTDPRLVELLLQRARMEREEAINQWKQKGHIMEILQPQLSPPDAWLDEEEFFRRFLDGTLREKTVWADWDQKKLDERVAKLRTLEAQEVASGDGTPPDAAEEFARIDALLTKLSSPISGKPKGSNMQ